MSARDRNAAPYRRDEGLNARSLRWMLDDKMLLCALCGVGQFGWDAGEPFQHAATCAIDSEFAKHPWHALAALLRELPELTHRSVTSLVARGL